MRQKETKRTSRADPNHHNTPFFHSFFFPCLQWAMIPHTAFHSAACIFCRNTIYSSNKYRPPCFDPLPICMSCPPATKEPFKFKDKVRSFDGWSPQSQCFCRLAVPFALLPKAVRSLSFQCHFRAQLFVWTPSSILMSIFFSQSLRNLSHAQMSPLSMAACLSLGVSSIEEYLGRWVQYEMPLTLQWPLPLLCYQRKLWNLDEWTNERGIQLLGVRGDAMRPFQKLIGISGFCLNCVN